MSTETETPTQDAVETETPVEKPQVDLDGMLSEFRDATKDQPVNLPTRGQAEQEQPQETQADLDQAWNAAGLQTWALDVETERQANREAADVARVVAEAQGDIASYTNLPENFADRWFKNEYMTNPELQQAWDSRHTSDDAMDRASRYVKRALRKLTKEAMHEDSRIAGLQATQDRAAVVAAMTRGSRGAQPEGSTPDYSSAAAFSDNDFRADVKKRYGVNLPI